MNIHQIGIDAPPNFVFNEILKWNGSSCWWPNHIARVNLQNGKLEDIRVTLLGKSKYAFGIKKGIFGFDYLHLFNLNALVFQHTPKPEETDNARYLLYKCSGGYPIGVCAIFVRSSFPEREEERHVSQLFFMVGFNFYGKPSWSNFNPVRLTWEGIHNRVTGNVVNRIKQLCEGIYTNGENSQ